MRADSDLKISESEITFQMSVIGAIILSRSAAETVCAYLRETDFSDDLLRSIFLAVRGLLDSDEPIDFLTIPSKMGQAGSESLANSLIRYADFVPSTGNAMYYAEQLRKCVVRRQLAEMSESFKASSSDPELDPFDLISKHQTDLELLASGIIADPSVSMGEISLEEVIHTVPTGLYLIDQMMEGGGLPCGQMNVVMAQSGVGKTPFLLQFANEVWKSGHNVCYAIFADLTPSQLKRRLIKLLTGMTKPPTNLVDQQTWDDAVATIEDAFNDNSIIVYDGQSVDGADTIENFEAWLRNAHRKHNFRAVCVDYIQEITVGSESLSSYEEMVRVGKRLRRLSSKLGDQCTMLVGSQVTETSSGKNKMRYGAESVHKAGVIIEIIRELGQRDTKLRLAKNRFGQPGTQDGYIFDPERLRFIDPLEG